MKKKATFYINCFDVVTGIAFGLVILLRELGVDGSDGGIDFANIVGRVFLVMLFASAGIHLFAPREWRHSLIFHKLFRRFPLR